MINKVREMFETLDELFGDYEDLPKEELIEIGAIISEELSKLIEKYPQFFGDREDV